MVINLLFGLFDMHKTTDFLFFTICFIFFSTVHAEPKAKMFRHNPSACEIFYSLNNGDVPDFCPEPRRTRGGVKDLNQKPNAVAFSDLITFKFNSARLTPQSTEILDKLLAVIQHNKMQDKSIRLEGHTDIIGSKAYNQQLSELRAQSVKQYFVLRGVNPQRLQTAGYGFSRLYDAEHPKDAINRRVEFVNLGP